MSKPVVAIVPYENPRDSVRKAVTQSRGFDHLPPKAKVFIKPNIVFWTAAVPFPKWGVITTSRIVEDVIIMLMDHGITDITVGEGIVTHNKDTQTAEHAFDYLGYNTLKKRYGVKIVNVMERPFEKVDLGDGMTLNFNADILNSDFVADLPVLKTHAQTVVSLGIKNLKGTIDIASRKKCHSPDPVRNLHFWVSRLAHKMPPIFTLIDGIYSNERGPGPDGRMRRTNLLIASADVLSADLVGSRILGHAPENVPHLAMAAANQQRPTDLSDIDLTGEPLEDVCTAHEYEYKYCQAADGSWMPEQFLKEGLQGVSYRKYDSTLCTYCSMANGFVLTAIRSAWQGQPWDKVEVLTGKAMQPTPGMNKTILLGKCIYQAHKENPLIKEMIAVKGCPPKPEDIFKALRRAGIMADERLFQQAEKLPGLLMQRYKDKPEFEEAFYRIV
jgi:uncharacterized protein (DUF362 family)